MAKTAKINLRRPKTKLGHPRKRFAGPRPSTLDPRPSPAPHRSQLEASLTQLTAKNAQLIEARRILQAANRVQSYLFDSGPIGLLRLNPQGKILYINRVAAFLLGSSKRSLLDRSFGSVLGTEEGQKFRDHLYRCQHTVSTVVSEFKVTHPRGQSFVIECQSSVLRSVKHQVIELHTTLQNATAQVALRESEKNLRALLDASPHPIQLLDATGAWQLANRAALKMFGLTGRNYIGKSYADLAPHVPFHRTALIERHLRHLAAMGARAPQRHDEILPQPDGPDRTYDTIRVPLTGPNGQVTGLVVLGYDLTERKQSEDAVRENDELMRLILETALDAVVVFDQRGVITHWNPEAQRLFGWHQLDAVGKTLGETILPAEPRHGPWNPLAHFLANPGAPKTKQRLQATARHRDGGEFPVELSINPTPRGEEVWFSAFIRDLTQRQQAERRDLATLTISRILATERNLDDAIPKLLGTIGELLGFQFGAMWVPDHGGEVLRCQTIWQAPNAGLEAFASASLDAAFAPGLGLPGRIWTSRQPVWIRDLADDDNFPRFPIAAADGLHTGFGFPIVRHQSVLCVMEFFSREFREVDEVFMGTVKAIGDQIGQFLERLTAEAALTLMRDQLANANTELDQRVRERTAELSQTNAALKTEILARNQAEQARLQLAAIVESSADAIVGRNLDGLITSWNKAAAELFGWTAAEILGQPFHLLLPPGKRHELAALDQRLKNGETVGNFEAARLRKNGRLVQVSITHSPVRDDNGVVIGMSAIMRDISERRQLQEEVLGISEREQSRIAQDLHDSLGQQLVGIFCLSDVLKKNLAEHASPGADEAARISKLLHAAVGQTRGLARGLLPVAPEPGGLMAALEELAGHLANLFKIHCQFVCPSPVMIEDSAVAANLFRIAQEAATNAIKHGRAQHITIELAASPERITLAVRDNGAGLPKPACGSKGLGLRIMNHRAGVIGGALVVQNKIGGGAEVLCTLDQPVAKTSNGQNQNPD